MKCEIKYDFRLYCIILVVSNIETINKVNVNIINSKLKLSKWYVASKLPVTDM
jgi:hypothetical protein